MVTVGGFCSFFSVLVLHIAGFVIPLRLFKVGESVDTRNWPILWC